ncbi:MAG: ABC transporter ATP-binding protein [Gemmatimonas sp.]
MSPSSRFDQSSGDSSVDMPANAVEVRGLAKTYEAGKLWPAKVALQGIDLAIPRGSFFGLLGPNGAGKSTLINILAGLVMKTAGQVKIWGHDLDGDTRSCRLSIGVVPQELNIDPFFSPRELLDLQAGYYAIPPSERRTMEILEAVGLTDKAEAYARTLSGGMRRRLLIAKAMLHAPPILVLDEPTAGVDIELRQSLWAYMKEMNARGVTILLTTHYLEEAETLCDRIAIIDQGKLVACDTTPALLHRLDAKELIVTLADDIDSLPDSLADFEAEVRPPRQVLIRYRPSETKIGAIIAAIGSAGLTIADLTTEETSLEDIFLELTRAARENADDRAAEATARRGV